MYKGLTEKERIVDEYLNKILTPNVKFKGGGYVESLSRGWGTGFIARVKEKRVGGGCRLERVPNICK